MVVSPSGRQNGECPRKASQFAERLGIRTKGDGDNLVFAVALACWNHQNMYPDDPAGGEQWWTNKHQADAARIFREGGKDKKDKK